MSGGASVGGCASLRLFAGAAVAFARAAFAFAFAFGGGVALDFAFAFDFAFATGAARFAVARVVAFFVVGFAFAFGLGFVVDFVAPRLDLAGFTAPLYPAGYGKETAIPILSDVVSSTTVSGGSAS